MSNHFVIFDGHAIAHRAYHALPPLTNRNGELTSAAYGFLLVFLKALNAFEPTYVAVCFDTGAKTFRDELYKEYKANRAETDAAFKKQIPMIQDILRAFGVAIVEKDGYEADDCIGTLVAQGKQSLSGTNMIVVTGDMDMLQLVDDRVFVCALRKGMGDTVLIDADAVKERYGITPTEVVDWKALRGDVSDNIPGVKGVGEKTAYDLIQRFHSIERLYASLDAIESKSVRAKLEHGKELALLSRRLATIRRDVPLGVDVRTLEWNGFDEGAVTEKLLEYGFRSLIARIPAMKKQGQFFFSQKNKEQGSGSKEQVTKNRSRNAFVIPYDDTESKQTDLHAFDVLDSRQTSEMADGGGSIHVETVQISRENYAQLTQEWQTCGLVVRVCNEKSSLVIILCSNQKLCVLRKKDIETHKSFLQGVLSSPQINKIGHDLKTDYKLLKSLGITLFPLWFDCKIAGYVLDAGTRNYELLGLVERYAPDAGARYIVSQRQNIGRVWSHDRMQESAVIFKLCQILDKELVKRKNDRLFHTFDMPLVSILAEMELAGIQLDVGLLKTFGKDLAKKLSVLTKQIVTLSGSGFNINSTKQLNEVLFEKLGISAVGLGRTKTGISTGAQELEKIRDAHPIIPKILEYRELFKLKSTYVDTLPTMVDKDSRIHTTFHQTIVATGRLSSQDPNLQNIPIRTTEGSRIRKAFVANRGWKLLAADYSQFELRVVASLSRDPELTRSFQRGVDIHTATAANVFHVPLVKVTPEQRRIAKTINFGIIYGLGARGLAQTTGMSVLEAKDFIRNYFEIHRGLKGFFDKVLQDGREKGYAETLFGRRRYLPDLNSPIQRLRAAAERMAINHSIQGTQADLLKLAMIHVRKALTKEGLLDDVKMVVQVHDELIFEIRDTMIPKARKIIEHELAHVYTLNVPIEVEIGIGKNWAECHK